MKLIGIVGKKKAGKSTVASYIKALLPTNSVTICGFADALKLEVSEATHETVEFIEANKDNFRLILQGWGTDFRRQIYGPNYWVNKLYKIINEANFLHGVNYFVVPDVRFLNEAQMIQLQGGCLIRVHRMGMDDDMHQSEQEMEKIVTDHTILNYESLEYLKEKTKSILALIINEHSNRKST